MEIEISDLSYLEFLTIVFCVSTIMYLTNQTNMAAIKIK